MPLDDQTQIELFKEYLETLYSKDISSLPKTGKKYMLIDFMELSKLNIELAEQILDEPLETIENAEIALLQINEEVSKDVRLRFKNLPNSQMIKLRDIRSSNIGSLLVVEGIVRQASDVRPRVVSAKFECPTCGTIHSILQIDQAFKEPARCSCGRKGKFRLLNKKLVDAQRIILEEAPESLEGGEHPKRMPIFLKEDLVEPKMEKKTTPGSKARVIGILKEIPIHLRTGGQSTQFDLAIESNYIEPIQESFDELDISREQELEIKRISKDPKIFDKLISSIAPSIFGYEEIKASLMLQLLGGSRKEMEDGGERRGDIHILLVGDPGVAKCVAGDTNIILGDGTTTKIGPFIDNIIKDNSIEMSDGHFANISQDILIMDENCKFKNGKAIRAFKRKPSKMYEISTKTGKNIRVTHTHPFFISSKGKVKATKSSNLNKGDFIAIPRVVMAVNKIQKINGNIKRGMTNSQHITIPKELDNKFARFIGYLLSEGYLRDTKTTKEFSFTNKDSELLDDFTNCTKKLFNLNISKKRTRGCTTLSCFSKELGKLLNLNIPEVMNKSRYRYVPNLIMKSPESITKEFLKSFIDAEGSIRKNRRMIEVSSANEELIDRLSSLLLRFRIISSKKEIWNKASNSKMDKRKYHKLTISGKFAIRYLKKIGFISERKKTKAESYIFAENKLNTNIDIIPNISQELKHLRKMLGLRQKDFGVKRSTFQHYENGTRNPSREKFKILTAYLNIAYKKLKKTDKEIEDKILNLVKLSRTDIFWDEIVKIKKTNKDKWIYDFEVEETHNFITNQIYSHNSRMLEFITKIAPKGRFVSGKGSSGAGLTAAVVRDEFLKGWALEAGAMPLSNGGLLCIDELDKMSPEDRSALHEGMEQQKITISKANIQATLNAKTTVLAAANPKLGRFDPYSPIAAQVDLPPTLINRFDLIFPIRDLPSKEHDEKIASHVLNLYREPEKLQTPLSQEFIRRYISYSKQKTRPKLTKEAIEEIKTFYVTLRNSATSSDEDVKPIPISARQLEALVRLSEASAKVRLSNKVTREDAKRAIILLQSCLMQVGFDKETGQIDIDRISSGISAAKRSKINLIKDIISHLESKGLKTIPMEDIMSEAVEKGLTENQVEEILSGLKRSGEIFEPKRNYIQKI